MVPGQTLFVQFFAEAKVFAQLCPRDYLHSTCDEQILQMTQIINTLYVVLLGVQLACGGAFDRMGGRFCGAAGSLVVAGSYLGIALMVHLIDLMPALGTIFSNIIMLLVAAADIGAWLNNYAIMGMIWHYAAKQKLVFALMNAAYQVGALYTMGAEWIMGRYDISLPCLLVGWTCLQLLSTVVLWRVTPGRHEYFAEAEKVLGVPLPRENKHLYDSALDSWQILGMDAWAHALLGVTVTLGSVYTSFYMSVVIPFGRDLFGSEVAARRLGDMCALANGLMSLAIVPILCVLGDRYGFTAFVNLQLVVLIMFSATFWVDSWTAAMIAVSSNVAYTSINYMISGSWFVFFSPPNRIGMMTGLWSFISALLFIVIQSAITEWSQELPQGLDRFLRPLVVCGGLAIISAAYFCVAFARASPFPAQPRRSLEDEALGLSLKVAGRTLTVYGSSF